MNGMVRHPDRLPATWSRDELADVTQSNPISRIEQLVSLHFMCTFAEVHGGPRVRSIISDMGRARSEWAAVTCELWLRIPMNSQLKPDLYGSNATAVGPREDSNVR